MGSSIALKNVEAVRNLHEAVTSGMLSLSPKALEYLQKANQASKQSKWEQAVGFLRMALKETSPNPPENLKKNLAVCLVTTDLLV